MLIGVAGGVKDVTIGDVVVATKVYGYESGKEDEQGFKPRPDVLETAYALQQRAREVRQKPDWKGRLDPALPHAQPRLFVEPIAAGEKVVASIRAATAIFLREHYGDAVAVEMEGRGFLEGIHLNAPVHGCVIRGVSDQLEGKGEADAAGSQSRAADAASAVAFEILATLHGATDRARPRAAATPSVSAARIPLTELRDCATNVGWCSDVRSPTVGDNDWWTFSNRLRQAAVDGEIAFWGKRYIYDFGKDLDSEPLIKIPREHFEEFSFDPTRLAQADNYDIFTGRLGEPPSALKGSIFRDLHVDAAEARAWLNGSGRPPPGANVAVFVTASTARIDDYEAVCSLIVKNVGTSDLNGCLVEMTELSGRRPADLQMPLTLRTDGQIRGHEHGHFQLLRGQERTIPLIFRLPRRANEWFFFDECARKYPLSANPTKMIVRIYGGASPGNALVFVDLDAGWKVFPSVKAVPSIYTLGDDD